MLLNDDPGCWVFRNGNFFTVFLELFQCSKYVWIHSVVSNKSFKSWQRYRGNKKDFFKSLLWKRKIQKNTQDCKLQPKHYFQNKTISLQRSISKLKHFFLVNWPVSLSSSFSENKTWQRSADVQSESGRQLQHSSENATKQTNQKKIESRTWSEQPKKHFFSFRAPGQHSVLFFYVVTSFTASVNV